MKNIEELRNELSEVFDGLKKGDLNPKVASEMSTAANRIIQALKVQLEYATLNKVKPSIKFLDCN